MDEIQKLYDALSKRGYYTKSFDDFKVQFQDKSYQDKVYNVVSRDGLYTKSKDEFLTKYSPLPQEDTSKKKVSSVVSTTGGEVGTSEPPLRKEKVLDYLKSLKSPATIVSVGKEPIVSREEVILPVQRPKKIDTNFGLTKERVQKDISPKVEEISIDIDPINLAQTKAAQTKNLQEKQDYLTASDVYSQISIPSGYEAMMAASSPDLKKETATNQILLKRANQYKEETQGLRDIKVPDLFSANDEYIEANVMPQIERAAVKWKIKQNPSFEKELKAVGANIDTDDMQGVLGTAKMGSIMDEFLDSPSVASFAKSEDPNISIALQYAKDNNLKRNTEWGITSVANKVSREFEKSEQRRNPVAAFATESLKKDLDDVAKETLKPEEYRIYNDYIKGREEEYLDTPSFLQGFAEHGRSTLEGFANTIGKLTGVKEKDIIRERWKKEASNVSADPEGWRKFFSESGKISGLVATLAATGGVLRGAGMGAGLTAKTAGNVGDAVNISTAFLGDMIDDAVYKYPGEPVKQAASATFNTLLFMAMGRDIFPAAKIKSAFTAIKPEVEKVVSNLTNGSITREVARQEMNTLAKKAISIAGEGMAQNTKVAAELTGLGMLNEGLDVVMDMDEDKMRRYYPEGVHGDTFKSMFLGNALVSAVAGYGKYKAKNDIAKEAIYEAASNPKRYERIINDLSIKDPNVTKEELLGNLAFAVETKRLLDQRGLNEKQQKDYLLKALGERAAIAEKEKIADSNLKKEAEEKIKQAQAEKDAILAGEEVAEEPKVIEEEKIVASEPQVPEAKEKYRVEYFDPEKGEMTHSYFDSRLEGDTFWSQLTDAQKSKGVKAYFEKTTEPSFGEVAPKEVAPEVPAAPITEEELPFGETAPREVKETKEETNLKKRALNIEAVNPLVEVMQYFISGGKVNPEAIEQLFGKERRTGMGKINVEERKSRTSLTNKTAPGIEALAEKLAGVDRTEQEMEFRNAIEEVLLNHSGTKSMSEELVRDYDIDYQEQKRLAELEDINKDVEEETRLIVSQIPEAQQEEMLRVLDKFRDNQGFIDWRAIAREYEGGFEPVLLELSPESQKIIENAINQIKETGRVSGISPKALPAEAKAGDILRRAAEATRTGKISKLGGFRAGTGFDAVWDASLEVIAKALEGGASVADAIEQGLKYAKSTGWYKKLTNKEDFDNKYRNHLKEQYDAIQEPTAGEVPVQPKAGVSEKVEGGVPPAEPPKAPKEGEGTREERKKRLLNNIVTSPNVPESLKKQVEEKGLSYLPATQEEATRLANAIIDSIGIDAAVEAASRNEFTDVFGGVNTAVLTEAASRLTADPVRQAQIFDILDKVLRSKGQDISYMNEFYTKNPLGVVIYQNAQRKQEFNEFAEVKEKQWKEAHDILKSENEALKKELEDLKKKPEAEGVKVAKAKAAAARQRRAALIQKYRQNKGGGLTLSAGGLSKEGIEFVGEVALTYIQEGIANVEVIIQKVTADIKDALGKEPSDDIKSEIDQIARKKFQEKKGKGVIDRLKKKLEGLTDKEKEDVIRKSYKKLIESGALEFDDFKNIVADVIGKGPLSEADANKLKDLTKKINELEAKALEAQDKRTPEAIAAYRQAELEAAKAGKELSQMFNTKPNILKRITSIIQLSTLGVPSLVVNVAYNLINQIGLRAPIGVINSLLDRSISGTARMMGKRINPETNVFSRQTQREFFNKLNLGLREAGEQALTGLNRQDYIQKEIYGQQIQPLESMKALYRWVRGKQRLSTQEVVDKGLQASVGIPAEVVARLLNLGDKPLRFAAEGATAAEFAKALGVTGIDYNLFIMFPKAEAMRAYKNQGFSEKEAEQKADYIEKSIIKEGKRATFQQDNFLNDKLQQLFGSEKSGVGDFVKTLTVSPYIKIPSNAYWSYFNLAHPEIAIMQAMVYGGKAAKLKAKDPTAAKMALREARYWFAHAAVGFAYVSVISSMVNAGVFTPGTTAEESKKEREGRMYYGKPGSTNVTKLMSWLRGEDPTRIKGGYEIQNKWAGHIGTLGNAIARRELDLTPEQRKNRYMFVWELLNSLPKETLDELQEGIFSNTSSLFNALQSDFFTKRWALNTIGMLTNVVHPAALAQLSRAELPYYSTTKADSFMDELKNSFLQRSSTLREVLGKQPPAKIGVWGDKLEKKDNLMMRWFGISKLNPDNFAQPLYEDFKRTGNSAYFPPAIKPEIEDEGKVTKLSAKQTQELEMLVGQARKNLVAPLLNDEVKIGDYGYWSDVEDYFKDEENAKEKADDIKLDALKKAYSMGFETAKKSFLDEHPEFKGEKDKEAIKTKLKAMESVGKQLEKFSKKE